MVDVKKSKKWSQYVTEHSSALNLEKGIFTSKDPYQIALSLKQSALASKKRKGTPYQSAMSMLNFYINRAGKHLNQQQKDVLQKAKEKLREIFGRQ